MSKVRLLELDALRGIAAVVVVFYHYFYQYNEAYGHESIPVAWTSFGAYGVQLFFMVSGFVIFWSLKRINKPFDFIVSRFARLYPVFWCSVALTSVVVLTFGLPGYELSLKSAFLNALMFHEYLFVPHVDGVYWTLTIELTFYFWIYVLYLTRQLDRVEWFCIPLLLLSVAHSLDLLSVRYSIYKLFFLNYLPFFVAGISIYTLVYISVNRLSLFALLLSLVSTIAIYSFNQAMLYAVMYAVFYCAVSGRMSFLVQKPLIYFGAISYSLYLLHQNIGYVIIQRCYSYGISAYIGITLALVTSILLATFLTYLVEKPANTVIRRWYKNVSSRASRSQSTVTDVVN